MIKWLWTSILYVSIVFANLFAEDCIDGNFHACTVASHNTKGFRRLLETCQLHGIDMHVMGMGLPYPGNGQKLIYLREYLKNIPDDHIVLFVDGFDVLILAPKETIIEKFFKLNVPCVMASATQCYPISSLAPYFPESPTKFKYLNSGSIIGYAGHLRSILLDMGTIIEGMSDQAQLIPYYIKHQDKIFLDHLCELFCPMHGVAFHEMRVDTKNKTVECLLTKTTPCVIHGSGKSKNLYNYIYLSLFKADTIQYLEEVGDSRDIRN